MNRLCYQLVTNDGMKVLVWQREEKINGKNVWMYGVYYSDGSSHPGDSDWYRTERDAKEKAKVVYSVRTGKHIKRAKWMRIKQ